MAFKLSIVIISQTFNLLYSTNLTYLHNITYYLLYSIRIYLYSSLAYQGNRIPHTFRQDIATSLGLFEVSLF